MKHTEVKKLAEKIGNQAQDVAEAAQHLVEEIESADGYEDTEAWIEEVSLIGEEFVAELDILATASAEARDAIAAALTDRSRV